MKLVLGRFGVQGFMNGSEYELDLPRPVDRVKALVLGLTALLLFSLGLYILISGTLIAFLALVH